jgi:hypothetical protein
MGVRKKMVLAKRDSCSCFIYTKKVERSPYGSQSKILHLKNLKGGYDNNEKNF